MKVYITRIIFRIFLLVLLGGGVWLWFALSPVRHAPGVLIRYDPLLVLGEPTPLDPVGDYQLQRLAGYHIDGRVLSVQRPRDGHAALAPIDVVVGWGPMSDSAVLAGVSFEQKERGYRWEASNVPDEVVRRHTALLHLIIADVDAATIISQVREGSLISLRGSLVKAQRGEFQWGSTLRRDDTGHLAKELFHVTHGRWFEGDHELALQRWFALLTQEREHLDLTNADAVRAFNREAQRYMEAAHPQLSPPAASPAATATP